MCIPATGKLKHLPSSFWYYSTSGKNQV